MARQENGVFDVVASMDFSNGFQFGSFSWQVESLSSCCRSREFSIRGCAGVKWSLVVEKSPTLQTTIGLYCKDAPVLIPAVFRITLRDSDGVLLINRSCYFTFYGGSSGCGFNIENWALLERRVRLQSRPLTAHLMIDIPKDKSFLKKSLSTATTAHPSIHQEFLNTLRAEFEFIESSSNGKPPSFSDMTVVVAKDVVDDETSGREQPGKREDKELLCCHRHVLCSHSAVFRRMLEKTDFLESSQGLIDVSEDVDRATMIALLRYMYCGEVGKEYEEFKVELDAIVRLLNAAEKYELAGLKQWCQCSMIVGYDTDEQRRRQLPVAEMFNLKQLRAVCVAQLSSDQEQLDENQVDGNVVQEIVSEKKCKNAFAPIELK